MDGKNQKKVTSGQVAMCGVFSALGLVFMLIGSILPFSNFTAPMLASLCAIPVLKELGSKYAILMYVAVSLLSIFFSTDPEGITLYILLLGYYPIVQQKINLLKSKVVCGLIKSALYYVAIFITYSLIMKLFFPAVLEELASEALWLIIAMVLAGQLAFFVFDQLVVKASIVYDIRFKKK